MDPRYSGTLDNFVHLHAHRLPQQPDKDRAAHLVYHSESGMSLDAPIVVFTLEEIISTFDTDNATVRWLIRQVQTYDMTSTRVFGLIFDKNHVLAHVLRRGSVRDEED